MKRLTDQTTEFGNLVHMAFLIRKEFSKYVEGPVRRDRSIAHILVNLIFPAKFCTCSSKSRKINY